MNLNTEKIKKSEKKADLGTLNEHFVNQDHSKNLEEFEVSNERPQGKVNKLVELDTRSDDFREKKQENECFLVSIEQRKLRIYLYSARYFNTLCLLYTVIIMIIYLASIKNFEYAVYFFLFEVTQGLLFALSTYMTIKYTVCNRFISPVSSLFIVILIIIVVVVEEPVWKVIYSIMILVSIIANFLSYKIIIIEGKMETEEIIKTRLFMKRNRIF